MSWQVRALAVLIAALGLILNDATDGWAEPVAWAVVALVLPIFMRQFREFWGQSRFWITVSLMAIIQIPLVIAVRLPMHHGRPYYSLAFVIIDGLVVCFVILFVCSKSDTKGY